MSAIKMQVEMGGRLARVTLCRPERLNAFDKQTLRELGDVIRGLAGTEKVRVLVLTGEGDSFCAGGDLHAAAASDSISFYLGNLARAFHVVLTALGSCPALVVTLVNGVAAGGGFALALAGDLRIGTPDAWFSSGYGRVGLSVDGGLSWRLPRIVGMAQAQRILFEDPEVTAEEAKALGLLHRVTPPEEVGKALEEIVERASLQSRGAIVRTRQLLLEGEGRSLALSYEAEAMMMKTGAGTNDGREGVRAFIEDRPPAFRA